MIRFWAAFVSLFFLVACSGQPFDPTEPLEPIGDFRVAHIGIAAPNPQKLLVSREATPEELMSVLETAMEQRFRRFEGARLYHLGISIEGYSLPPPVVPGKSYLAVRVTVWDDAKQAKLNEEPKLIAVPLLIESRIASSREASMEALANETAKTIETWLREQMEEADWFKSEPVPATPLDPAQGTLDPALAPEANNVSDLPAL